MASSAGSTSNAVARPGPPPRTASIARSEKDETPTGQPLPVACETTPPRTQAVGRPRSRCRDSTASGLYLDIDRQRATGLERLDERGQPGRQLARRKLRNSALARQLGVVVDDEGPVRSATHVELDPIGPERPGGRERRHRVLPNEASRPAVGKDFRQRVLLSFKAAELVTRATGLWSQNLWADRPRDPRRGH